MPILPMLLGAFQPPKPAPGGPATVFPGVEIQELPSISLCLAATSTFPAAIHAGFTLQQILFSGVWWLKSSEKHG